MDSIIIPKEFVEFLIQYGNAYTVFKDHRNVYVNLPQLIKVMPDGTGLMSQHDLPISTAQCALTDATRIILDSVIV